MDQRYYLREFQSATGKLDKTKLSNAGLDIFTGVVMDSVALKVYKPAWSNDPQAPLTAPARIFFSIWVNEESTRENRLYYNIHAFKLRLMKGCKIASRDFAERFRSQFKTHQKQWPNVDADYGPLTLMQGWIKLDRDAIQKDIAKLVAQFDDIHHLIDKTLAYYKTPGA